MKKLIGLTGLFLMFIVAGMIYATAEAALINGTFDYDLSGWNVYPEPEEEAEYVVWDWETQSVWLQPYGHETGEDNLPDTYDVLSQIFQMPLCADELSFDIKMLIVGREYETDVLSVSLAGNSIYRLSSSDVNDAAFNDSPYITNKDIDSSIGELINATYQRNITVGVSSLANQNVELKFHLLNENSDGCVSTVWIDNVIITEADRIPPAVEIGGMIELWPPNHKYHTFKLSDCVSVMDNVDGQMDVDELGRIVSIYSDEPEEIQGNGDGNTYNDIVIISDYEFKVRSERQGPSNGRVYGITFEISDESENTTTATFYLGVPHDQSGDPPVDDGAGAGYTVVN